MVTNGSTWFGVVGARWALLASLAAAGCSTTAPMVRVEEPAPPAPTANVAPTTISPASGGASPTCYLGAVPEPDETRHGTASLYKEAIRQVIRGHLGEVRYCYESALTSRPTLAGRVIIQFIVGPGGHVRWTRLQESMLGAPDVEECIGRAMCGWQFPSPEGDPDGVVEISYPFVLETSRRQGVTPPSGADRARRWYLSSIGSTRRRRWPEAGVIR